MDKRGSGILLHITSLPTPYGTGDMGPSAYAFADTLAKAEQSYWQVLPLNMTNPIHGNSPYSSISAFAGNTIFISPDVLVEEGLLTKEQIALKPPLSRKYCDYQRATSFKEKILNYAYDRFKTRPDKKEYLGFCAINSYWLEDFALYAVIKKYLTARSWNNWPLELRDRDPHKLQESARQFKDEIEKENFFQYLFYKQWFSLKKYCNGKGIKLIGDIPIYVNNDSVDVWTNPKYFKLDPEKNPSFVAGVPPDYFSKTGQLWGNPVYNWDVLKEDRYKWWFQRIEHNLSLYDIVRLDHFRGLVTYWQVPATEKTAMNGENVDTPAEDFFYRLLKRFKNTQIIAETLGVITDRMKEILKNFDIIGMKVMLFAFREDNPAHPYLPHNYIKNCVVYTGTHDTNTLKGWFLEETDTEIRKRIHRYFGKVTDKNINWTFIRAAMMSIANTVIFPLQDILCLGSRERMNTPSTMGKNNWNWRITVQQLKSIPVDKLSAFTKTYGRGINWITK